MILDLYLFLRPRLTLMDGIVAMEGNGPGSGDPKALGLLFASGDALAMDRVAAEVLGARCDDLPILRRAREVGIYGAEPARIEVVGEKPQDVRVRGFRFPPLANINFTANLPYFIDRRIRRALTVRPRISTKKCTVCGACVDVCQTGAMEVGGQIIIDCDKCIRCFCCQEICPEMAISVKQGWLKRILAYTNR
jgi:ferredoxin